MTKGQIDPSRPSGGDRQSVPLVIFRLCASLVEESVWLRVLGCVFCWFGYIEMGEFGFAGGLKKEGTRDRIERRERN